MTTKAAVHSQSRKGNKSHASDETRKGREGREGKPREKLEEGDNEDFQTFLKRQATRDAAAESESLLLVRRGAVWHQLLAGLEPRTGRDGDASKDAADKSSSTVSVQTVEKLRREGAAEMETETAQYGREQKLSRADAEWNRTVLRGGTVSDRCAALTLALQTSPVHGLEHLKGLIALAGSKSRHEAFLALEALRDLFSREQGMLPPGRKLRYIHQQPIARLSGDSRERRQAVLLWHWEEALKTAYLEVVRLVEVLTQDAIGHSRERACRLLNDLLIANPHEQSGNILALLANKLGDPERRLASRIPYYLTELVNAHPRVLATGALEHVRTIIDRPGCDDRTRYYALCFLVQIRLQRGAPAITAALLQIYLGLFTRYILNNLEAGQTERDKRRTRIQKRNRHRQRERGEDVAVSAIPAEHARMARALLTGINRALPFATGTDGELRALLVSFADPLLKLCGSHVALPTTLQALGLLFTLAVHEKTIRERALKTLCELLDEQDRLRQASASHPALLRLLPRAISLLATENDRTALHALLKALLRFCLAIVSPAFVIAALVLVSTTIVQFPALRTMLNHAPETADEARHGALYELIALTRHYHPRVRRYALAVLQTSRVPCATDSDRAVNAAPYERLSFAFLLDVWNRMRRANGSGKTNSGGKREDTPEQAAQLYAMDEFRFIQHFAAEKDAMEAAEKAERKRRWERDHRAKSSQEATADPAADEATLEAEADAIMDAAIRRQAAAAFGGDNEDDDEGVYSEVDSGSDDEDDGSAFEFEDGSDIASEDEDEAGLEDDDNEDDEADLTAAPSASKNKRRKRGEDVFANASDYDDAL